MLFRNICLIFVASGVFLGFTSCGGGGGGGDGGGSGRTRDTGLRIVHAAIDTVPVSILSGPETFVQSARYAEATSYIPLEDGPINLSVERLNSPGVVLNTLAPTLEDKTEYTLFIFGSTQDNTLNFSLLTDTTDRPEPKTAHLAVLNGYQGPSFVSAESSDVALGQAVFGGTTGFQIVASGPQTIIIRGPSGNTLSTISTQIADRGELTILITGSDELGVLFTTLYSDLD